ncbi:MAG TPA: ATP-binding protein [Mycobacterium sp.]|nr:ATP-binding protein [Mycobacterium sp.]
MVTSGVDLDRVRQLHQLRSFRIGSVLRIGVVALMLGAMLVGTTHAEWPGQEVVLVLYVVAAASALILAFSPAVSPLLGTSQRQSFLFTIIDVAALIGFQMLSTAEYIPLVVVALLPIMVGLDVSLRRATVVLGFSVAAFAFVVLQDRAMTHQLGWPPTLFVIGMYGFLCCCSLLVVYLEQRHANAIAGLTALREDLLAETMTASEVLQRRVSESLHDGPLQDVLAARRELRELATTTPSEALDRALAGLQDAAGQLREATFELHPAVLDKVGLGAAVEQLASFIADRSGIAIVTDIDYPTRSSTVDPILFGVARELLSNVVRHSQATDASVRLALTAKGYQLDVADNGIGIRRETAARRLGEGHIGLASHQTRVEAAGGDFTFIDVAVGTHIRVQLPLR